MLKTMVKNLPCPHQISVIVTCWLTTSCTFPKHLYTIYTTCKKLYGIYTYF
jgi:hypothetical protein